MKGKGNSVSYKYRMHDPRIGRFFACDPMESVFSYNSPYAFSENSTIAFVELEGLERITAKLKFKNGKPVLRKFKSRDNYTLEFGKVFTLTFKGKKYQFHSYKNRRDQVGMSINNSIEGWYAWYYGDDSDQSTYGFISSFTTLQESKNYDNGILNDMLRGTLSNAIDEGGDNSVFSKWYKKNKKVTKALKEGGDGIAEAKLAKQELKAIWQKRMQDGLDFEAEVLGSLKAEGLVVEGRLTIIPENGRGRGKGNKMNTDALIKNEDGTFTVIEAKLSNRSKLSTGQNRSKKHIDNGNGVFTVRSNNTELGLKKGDKITIKKFERRNKNHR